MSSYTKKLMQGTLFVCLFFLASCLSIYFLLPAQKTVSPDFNTYAALLGSEYLEDTDVINGFKSELNEFPSEGDKGLELYRRPLSRPVVEWFYTQVTSNRDVTLAILENADKNNIPLSMAFSLAFVESRFKPNAVNRNTNTTIDRGLFQLNSASFPSLTENEFFDPRISAKYGMLHLRWCMDLAGKGNDVTALAMYNAGTTRVRNNKTPQHTLNYVAKISAYRAKLEQKFNNDVVAYYSVDSRTSGLVKK